MQHGYDRIKQYFEAEDNRQRFLYVCDQAQPECASTGIKAFDDSWNGVRFNTYVTSLSEHDPSEDQHGRLSMWRAFGRTSAKVAIIIKKPQNRLTSKLNLLISPVAYFTSGELTAHFTEIRRQVILHRGFLSRLNKQIFVNTVQVMLISGVICLKHEGFLEEKEWRVFYLPSLLPSELMKPAVETISGIPQTVLPIPLDHTASGGEVDLREMIDRLIIGPSPYPWVLYDAFCAALRDAGVADAEKKVFVSGIPLRD